MNIRYDDMRIDRLLTKEYQKQLDIDLKRIKGQNDIELLLGEFEKIFAKYIGVKWAVALNSGSDAIQLALYALNLKKGSKVIIPNLTYPAVALSAIYAQAKPVFVDVKAEDLEIDEDKIEGCVDKETKAVIAVHMFARACQIEKIQKIAQKNNLFVIEDCCQAESSEYKNKKLGSFAEFSCFSFSYYKPLSSCGGGGGMLCFNQDKYKAIAEYTKVWQDNADLLKIGRRFPKMYLLDLVSLEVKFKYLKEIIKSRLKIKKIYEDELSNLEGVKIFKDADNSLSVPQNFPILCKKREALGKHLYNKGIAWQRPYMPLHMMQMFKDYAHGDFSVSQKYWEEAIQLPLFSFMDENDCFYVCETVKEFFK